MTKSSLRIAVADDELDMREFLGKVLPILGHTVIAAAENGQQLIDASLTLHPNMIITDLRMPVCDGMTAMQEIWKSWLVPVIFISAFTDEVTHGPLGNSPWISILTKPVRMHALKPAIEQAWDRFQHTSNHFKPPVS